MRPAFAQAHQHTNISSYEPKSSKPTIFASQAAAQLVRSPQLTTSLLPAYSHARRDLRPTLYAAQSHEQRRVFVALIQSQNGDADHGDDPHGADSLIEDRPQLNANRAGRHVPGDVRLRPPLRGFASSEKVLSAPPPTLPFHHSAPFILPTAAGSVPSLCASFFGDRSDRSGGHPFAPYLLFASVPRVPRVLAPFLSSYSCGHTRAHHSTTAAISSNPTLPTPAH